MCAAKVAKEGQVSDLAQERKKPRKGNRARRSEAWTHFEATDEGRECKHCGRLFSTTTATGTLMNHIKCEHDDDGDAVEVQKEATFEKKRADALVTKLITKKCLPLSLVEDEDFVQLLKYLCPKYEPPKRRNLRRELPKAKTVLAAATKKK
ncbi:Zinc-finger domain containing protein [Pandoravirus quercus]|uniref:Zinc-finger domain containing protein n=1 Tax=Pandoravirus quercus TaxID=2107709 RepID=A0A2U7UAQ3_9VIRU|nr:Zinc-finger domain containing protein [Pandoravirus quercus]AVK75528.1 Zinc-finger domain containing protein [Pandoravirus quercus]